MNTAKLFTTGRSQAVRLPKACRMEATEVRISHDGNKIILKPLDATWDSLIRSQ